MSFVLPERRRIRLKGYDYSRVGLYAITLLCRKRLHLFGKVQNQTVLLNEFGKIAFQAWTETPLIRPNVGLEAFVIMPNHMHAIISIHQYKGEANQPRIGHFISPTQTVGAIVRGYKGAVTKRIKVLIQEHPDTPMADYIPEFGSVWHPNYYEQIIKDDQAFYNISNYIWDNPKNWKKDQWYKGAGGDEVVGPAK